MILALEGPDLCGKTTLYEALRGRLAAVFLPKLHMTPEIQPIIASVDEYMAPMWSLLDPAALYVIDRCPWVSGRVYAELYGRRAPSVPAPPLRILYLDVPPAELARRHAARGDALFDSARFGRVIELYEAALPCFDHVRLDGTEPTEALVRRVLCL